MIMIPPTTLHLSCEGYTVERQALIPDTDKTGKQVPVDHEGKHGANVGKMVLTLATAAIIWI